MQVPGPCFGMPGKKDPKMSVWESRSDSRQNCPPKGTAVSPTTETLPAPRRFPVAISTRRGGYARPFASSLSPLRSGTKRTQGHWCDGSVSICLFFDSERNWKTQCFHFKFDVQTYSLGGSIQPIKVIIRKFGLNCPSSLPVIPFETRWLNAPRGWPYSKEGDRVPAQVHDSLRHLLSRWIAQFPGTRLRAGELIVSVACTWAGKLIIIRAQNRRVKR